ncbi:hypothetical protein [Fonticella tunisiensis]|uniref:Uncharacterized protein n=1 Tax=Fonticella tunisiensis TaxID=1096341 RepID=A0A4R7KTF6_9CLOT|nr:hypothetical protein [Fonticella tunisiensis]TDT63377.1 hypothetical protein EDD71_102137 [Fonticella tunisiensis]
MVGGNESKVISLKEFKNRRRLKKIMDLWSKVSSIFRIKSKKIKKNKQQGRKNTNNKKHM